MLRTIFVLLMAGAGFATSLRGPFHALLFYLWIGYFRPDAWAWEGIATTLPLSLFAGVWALALGVGSGKALRIDGRLALLLLFLLHTFVSSSESVYQFWVWRFWTDFLKTVSITYLLAVLVTDVRRLRLTLLVIVLSLGFEATKQGWVQLLFTGGKNYNAIPFLGDENGVAVGMFMLVPLAAALISTEARGWAKGSLGLVMVGVAYRGISTYSRGGFLTLVSIVGMYVVRSKRKMVAVMAVGVIAAGMSVLMNDAFWDRINSIGVVEVDPDLVVEVTSDDASTLSRLHYWSVAMLMANDRPFLGVGFNAYIQAYNAYDTSDRALNRGRRSVHSSWFGILSELGYPGMLLYLWILLLALQSCRRVRRLGQTDSTIAELVPFATAVETSLIAAMVGGTFVIFQYSEMLWHMVGLSIAMNRMVSARVAELRTAERRVSAVREAPIVTPLSARSMAR